MRQLIAPMALIVSLSVTTGAHAMGELIGGDINFKGTVVALGCSIVPSSKHVAVDFGEISTRTLYAEKKSVPQEFKIELQGCNSEIFKSVTVTFSGTKNANMDDRLAITSISPNSASGIGVGLEESDGTAIMLDTPTSATTISDATMQLNFKAFVEGEPDALKDQTLQTGPFRATANYILNYQ